MQGPRLEGIKRHGVKNIEKNKFYFIKTLQQCKITMYKYEIMKFKSFCLTKDNFSLVKEQSTN